LQEHKLKLLHHIFAYYDNDAMQAFTCLFPEIWKDPIEFEDLEEYSPNETAFPLLKLVTLNPSRAVFEQAYAAHPAAMAYEYEGFSTFWNAACQNGSLAVVECCLKLNDEKASLHSAIASNASPAIIRYLVQYHPELLRDVNDVGRLPLHSACASDMSTDTIHTLLEGYPDALTVTDWWDNVPFHLACRNGAPIETLKLLLGMSPGAFHQRNDNGESPFFCALRCSLTTPRILQWFLQVNPEILHHTDNYGETPLHAVCYEGSAANLKWLLDHYGDVPSLQDQKGNTPLHVALLHSSTPYDLSSLILQEAPECCAMRGEGGKLPLHTLFKKDVPFEFVEYLLEKFPEASETPDNLGRYPLHIASMVDGIPLDVVELIVATCPKALTETDKDGKRPVDYARASSNPSGALVNLLSQSMGDDEDEPEQKKRRVDDKPEDEESKEATLTAANLNDEGTNEGGNGAIDHKQAADGRKMASQDEEGEEEEEDLD
jgi:ankyrin repeat protein